MSDVGPKFQVELINYGRVRFCLDLHCSVFSYSLLGACCWRHEADSVSCQGLAYVTLVFQRDTPCMHVMKSIYAERCMTSSRAGSVAIEHSWWQSCQLQGLSTAHLPDEELRIGRTVTAPVKRWHTALNIASSFGGLAAHVINDVTRNWNTEGNTAPSLALSTFTLPSSFASWSFSMALHNQGTHSSR